MPEYKVFYSWQSDLPNATNRGFIQDALDKACKQIANNPEIEESPRLDQDTQGLPGAPSIPQAIMEKIDSCQAFVADVSLCYVGPEDTPAPNPNVVYELGYAVARLGWDRIILVVNTEFGPVEKLPFDLEKRRAIPYTAKEGEKDRSEDKKGLISRLAAGVEAIAKRQPVVTRVTPTEAARDAIASQTPDRIIKVRQFFGWFLESLDNLDAGVLEPQDFVDRLDSSKPTIEAFSIVTEAAAVVDDPSSIHEIWRSFDKVLARYDTPARSEGSSHEWQFDWWRFHGYEMCVILVAHLLRERKLSLIGELLREGFIQRRWAETRASSQADFGDLSDYVRGIYTWNEQLKAAREQSWISPQGEVFNRRYAATSPTLPSWEEFCEADLFLGLFGAPEKDTNGYERWLNQTHIYSPAMPRFILEARRLAYAEQLRGVFGASDIPQLIASLKERWTALNQKWRSYSRIRSIPTQALDAIGTI